MNIAWDRWKHGRRFTELSGIVKLMSYFASDTQVYYGCNSIMVYSLLLFLPSTAGDGKSYFIKNHMQSTCDFSTCIPVHEGFTAKKGIEKLRTLLSDATDDERILGVHFNITISPFWVRE